MPCPLTECCGITEVLVSDVFSHQRPLVRAHVTNQEDLQQVVIRTGRVWTIHGYLQV